MYVCVCYINIETYIDVCREIVCVCVYMLYKHIEKHIQTCVEKETVCVCVCVC